jgi:hypothetical protein
VITKEEVEAKAAESGLHAANIERDYVFGWLLAGIYGRSALRYVGVEGWKLLSQSHPTWARPNTPVPLKA